MERSTTHDNEDQGKQRRRRFRFQYSLGTLMLIVTVCALLLSYWASTRPTPLSAFFQAAAGYNSIGRSNANEIIGQTLKKLCGGNKTVHTMRSSSGRNPDGRGDMKKDALVILPNRLHKEYYDELRQVWLDLLDKTQCTVESDEPLPDHTEGFVLTYTSGKKQGVLRVYCKPGSDQIKCYHGDGRVTDVPYKDDILNVIVELHESRR